MPQKDYTYAVARIRSREAHLLDNAFLEQLLSQDYNSCIRLLSDKGWGDQATDPSGNNMLSIEEKRLWSFMRELVSDDSEFDVFLAQNDFHNLKVAIKTTTRKRSADGMLSDNGTVPAKLICDAISRQQYDELPDHLSACAKKAMSVLLTTLDGQLCDVIIDKACLDYVYKSAQYSGVDILCKYAELLVAASDIKIAIRCAKTNKSRDFALSAMSECKSLNIEKLAGASASGVEDIIEYLSDTEYKTAVDSIIKSMSAFEKWCDDFLISELEALKWDPFSFGAIVGYIVARENEIKSVRMILYGKKSGLDTQTIKERLRKTYV